MTDESCLVSSSPNPFSFREGGYKKLIHDIWKEKHIYGESPWYQIWFARDMRKNGTTAERYLWKIIRNKQFLNTKRRRQFPINNYIADFYCHEHKIIIELDGEIHDKKEQKKKDKKRTEILEWLEYKVLRFKNKDFLEDPEIILKEIEKVISEQNPPSLKERGIGGEETEQGEI